MEKGNYLRQPPIRLPTTGLYMGRKNYLPRINYRKAGNRQNEKYRKDL